MDKATIEKLTGNIQPSPFPWVVGYGKDPRISDTPMVAVAALNGEGVKGVYGVCATGHMDDHKHVAQSIVDAYYISAISRMQEALTEIAESDDHRDKLVMRAERAIQEVDQAIETGRREAVEMLAAI